MAKDIQQRIVLQGEKEYNQALKDANRNLKTLRSELKAETAEMGKNASEQQKSEARAKSLQKQIAEQEKIVRTLRAALEEARQEYGDNADVIATWEQRLNNARTTLGNMRGDLESVTEGMRQAGSSTRDSGALAVTASNQFSEALEKISGVGDSVSGAIEGIFSAMVSRITQAAQEVWALIAETAAKANNWGDLAGIYGTDAQTIQMYSRTLQSLGKDFNTLNTIASRLAMGGKGKEITEALGISDVNYQDKWAYMEVVMGKMAEMQEKGEDLGDLMETVFGERKSAGLIDLLNDWETIQETLPTFNGNETGYGMNDEQLQTMNDLSIQIDTITTKWEALKDRVAAGLGTMVMPLMVHVEGAMDGIASWLAAGTPEEKEAALAEVRKNLEDFFRKLGEILKECLRILDEVGTELKESDDPVTQAVGNLMTGIADALQWVIDNQGAVKDAFEAVFGMWLLAKLAAVAGQIGSIVTSMKTIQLMKLMGFGSGAANAATGAADAATGAAGGGGGSLLVSLGLNGLVAAGVWEAAKALPADLLGRIGGFLGIGAPGQEVLDEVNRQNGIETLGDIEDKVKNTDQEQNRKAMDFMFSTLLNPGAETHTKYEEPDLSLPEGGVSSSGAQRSAAENYWDTLRGYYDGTGVNEADLHAAFDAFEQAFEGQEDSFDRLLNAIEEKIDSGQGGEENLPEKWFLDEWKGGIGGNTGNTDGMTSGDARSMTDAVNKLPGEVRRGLTGVKIYMDKTIVGQLVAEEVSRQIAASIV